MFTWQRRGGYEVSTKGDKRFSAFNAILSDGLSIEITYQTKIKGYDTWREGKGKVPINQNVDLWKEYLNLWRIWANNNLPLMRELYFLAKNKNYILSDCFANTPINQAHALAEILNELIEGSKHEHRNS